jgi:Phage integrase family
MRRRVVKGHHTVVGQRRTRRPAGQRRRRRARARGDQDGGVLEAPVAGLDVWPGSCVDQSAGPQRPAGIRGSRRDIEDLGLERGHRTLTILRKGGKVVTVPLAPRTARAIDLAVGERCDGPIFVGADGQRIDRHAAGRIVRRIARRAGIAKRVGPHTLRHAFITAALDAGVPLRDVQEAASHADPRTTVRYDRARVSLDRYATYIVATFLAGASR